MIALFTTFLLSFVRMQYWKLRGWDVIVSAKEMVAREGRCERCCHFSEGTCKICGCVIYAKTMLAPEACPVGRWDRVRRKLKTDETI